jgi:hypothetical protein
MSGSDCSEATTTSLRQSVPERIERPRAVICATSRRARRARSTSASDNPLRASCTISGISFLHAYDGPENGALPLRLPPAGWVLPATRNDQDAGRHAPIPTRRRKYGFRQLRYRDSVRARALNAPQIAIQRPSDIRTGDPSVGSRSPDPPTDRSQANGPFRGPRSLDNAVSPPTAPPSRARISPSVQAV